MPYETQKNSKGHPHAALMLQYAKDAAVHNKPWEFWEMKCDCLESCLESEVPWLNLHTNPSWCENLQYRRKPESIRIGNFDVPLPVQEELELGQEYWIVDLTSDDFVSASEWEKIDIDYLWLERGLIHISMRDAQLHAKALISLIPSAIGQ